jgi:hypothetical protein
VNTEGKKNQTSVGFDRHICARAAEAHLIIFVYYFRSLRCPNTDLLGQNCIAPSPDDFCTVSAPKKHGNTCVFQAFTACAAPKSGGEGGTGLILLTLKRTDRKVHKTEKQC